MNIREESNLDSILLTGSKTSAFSDFPKSEFWRLGMEVLRQDEGPEAFHRGNHPEPGYMQGIRNGLDLLVKNIDKPLSADLLAAIHDACVQPISGDQIEKSITSYRDNESASYSVELVELNPRSGYFTKQGFLELIQKIKQSEKTGDDKDRYRLYFGEPGKAPEMFDLEKDDPEELYAKLLSSEYVADFYSWRENASSIKQRAQKYIDEFYKDIATVSTPKQKLDLIIKLIKDLEQLHPFPDANGRTISMLTLNKLLIDNNFSPIMLDNPNRIDGFGSPYSDSEELTLEIIKGAKNYQEYNIGELRDLLKNLSPEQIRENSTKENINNQLSANPIAAMAQLNALFVEIKEGKLPVQTQWLSFFRVGKTQEQRILMDVLKDLYLEKVESSLTAETVPTVSLQAYQEIISRHKILSDSKLEASVQEQVHNAFTSKQELKK